MRAHQGSKNMSKTITMSKKAFLLCLIGLIAVSLFVGAVSIYLLGPSPSTTPTETDLPTSCVVGDFKVTVTGANWIDTLHDYTPERENGRFLMVDLSVENIARSTQLFGVVGEYLGVTGAAEIAVIDGEGYEYPSFRGLPSPDSNIKWNMLPQMVGPRTTMEWTLAFDLPADAYDLQLGLRASKDEGWTMLKLDT